MSLSSKLSQSKETSQAGSGDRATAQHRTPNAGSVDNLAIQRSAKAPLHEGCTCGGTCPTCRRKAAMMAGAELGGQSTMRLPGGGLIQAALRAGSPGDPLEKEADSTADKVMKGGAPEISRAPMPIVQRACANCESETLGGATEAKVNAGKGAGNPLSKSTRSFLEPRFGRDLGHVRVHTDSKAAEAADAVNAKAFATGHDIVFGQGQYSPETTGGMHLLAHEVTHTIQQGATGKAIQRTLGDGHDLTSPRFAGDLVLEACFDNERVLQAGDTGAAVATIQHALVEGGFLLPNFGVDGRFEAETTAAVRAFQRARGLVGAAVDGKIGRTTMGFFDTTFPTAVAAGPAAIPNVPAPSGRAPTLTPVINAGPTPTTCGGVNFVINWVLSGNSGPQGGFVIQNIAFLWFLTDCTGAAVPMPAAGPPAGACPGNNAPVSPVVYYEAWRVTPNSTVLTPAGTDTFGWPRGRTAQAGALTPLSGLGTRGFVVAAATARYHDNVADIPDHMTVGNTATFAHCLRSSLADPNVGGDTSPSVLHNLVWHWDCCAPAAAPAGAPPVLNPTVVDFHTP